MIEGVAAVWLVPTGCVVLDIWATVGGEATAPPRAGNKGFVMIAIVIVRSSDGNILDRRLLGLEKNL